MFSVKMFLLMHPIHPTIRHAQPWSIAINRQCLVLLAITKAIIWFICFHPYITTNVGLTHYEQSLTISNQYIKHDYSLSTLITPFPAAKIAMFRHGRLGPFGVVHGHGGPQDNENCALEGLRRSGQLAPNQKCQQFRGALERSGKWGRSWEGGAHFETSNARGLSSSEVLRRWGQREAK